MDLEMSVLTVVNIKLYWTSLQQIGVSSGPVLKSRSGAVGWTKCLPNSVKSFCSTGIIVRFPIWFSLIMIDSLSWFSLSPFYTLVIPFDTMKKSNFITYIFNNSWYFLAILTSIIYFCQELFWMIIDKTVLILLEQLC